MAERVRVDLEVEMGKILESMEPRMSMTLDVWMEMDRQVAQWGVQNHHPAYWLAILGKQVGQMGSAILDREWAADPAAGTAKVRSEAVQAAAVAQSLIECIDRGEMPIGLVTAKPADKRQEAIALGIGDEQMDYDKDEPDPNEDMHMMDPRLDGDGGS